MPYKDVEQFVSELEAKLASGELLEESKVGAWNRSLGTVSKPMQEMVENGMLLFRKPDDWFFKALQIVEDPTLLVKVIYKTEHPPLTPITERVGRIFRHDVTVGFNYDWENVLRADIAPVRGSGYLHHTNLSEVPTLLPFRTVGYEGLHPHYPVAIESVHIRKTNFSSREGVPMGDNPTEMLFSIDFANLETHFRNIDNHPMAQRMRQLWQDFKFA